MNFSSGSNVTTFVTYHDAFYTAVTKNVIVVALFITINYFNGTLIHTFNKHQIFIVNPRYVLFIHLVVNDMIQLTVSVTLFIFSYVFYTINVSICCLVLLPAMLTTQNTPLYLASMAAECYIAICCFTLPDLFILLATEPLEFFYSRVLCTRETLFQRPYFHEKTNTSNIVLLVIVWLTLLYIYLRILFAATAAKGDARKARNTILIHGFQLLLCMLTYIAPVVKRAVLYWFPKSYKNTLFVCYIIIQILPRFLSPIVYGLRDQMFKRYLKRYLLCTVSTRTNPQIALKGHT
ncbi:odorant receptor 131-2-like [Centroberyx affinis]|uniref:odorant receptor 131-2-like n=1 Tax=Centroberyx affinis TaxID=166261 RepID=UPI003A5BF686